MKNHHISPKNNIKCITDSRDYKPLLREALKNIRRTGKMLQSNLNGSGIALSCKIILKRLFEAGLMARLSRKNQILTELIIERGLICEKPFINWTEVDLEMFHIDFYFNIILFYSLK